MQTFSRSQPCLVLSDNHIAYQPLTGQKHPGLIAFECKMSMFQYFMSDLIVFSATIETGNEGFLNANIDEVIFFYEFDGSGGQYLMKQFSDAT